MLGHCLVALLLAAPSPDEHASFTLYKWQKRLGVENAVVSTRGETTEVRTTFSFTDRGTTVPLSAVLLQRRSDGTPLRFQIWGSTSRFSKLDDVVTLAPDGRSLSIEESGVTRTAEAPPAFFTLDGYAPMIVTERLHAYWLAHAKPASIPTFPGGEVSIEARGEDEVRDDSGRMRRLTRYALTGIGWGRETAWFDEEGHLAALKGVDAEFDHFEATRSGYRGALASLVARAAADGMAELQEKAPSVLAEPDASGAMAFIGATLIDGTGAPPVRDAVVLVEKGRITAAGRRGAVRLPAGARRVDVRGKFIVPGLWDMHAHFEQIEWGPVYLAAGVTTVRDCGNELEFITAVRDAIDAGRGVGPRILLACLADGVGDLTLGNVLIRSAEDIPPVVERFQKAGCVQVKLYSSTDPKLIPAIAQAAHAAGMSVTGHVPVGTGAVAAVEAGFDGINHISFISRALLPPDLKLEAFDRDGLTRALAAVDFNSPSVKETLAVFVRHHTVIDPTVVLTELLNRPHDELMAVEPGIAKLPTPLRNSTDQGLAPEEAPAGAARLATALSVLRALHESGATIVAGTDQSVPGHSLHREMELYVSAGFTPMEAIQAATIVPARALGRDRELGTVEAGKRADLIVVDGDPLADIRNLRQIVQVVAGGRVYDPVRLWRSVGFTP
jgi:imidazolonepropionase-like amidohydrolase